jgi:uncharacterized RDD family membrane protein YckC
MQSYSPSPAGQGQAGYSQAQETRYRGFWIRLLARIIDGFVLGIPLGLVFGFLAIEVAISSDIHNGQPNTPATTIMVILYPIAALAVIAYYVFFWTRGGTLGMRLLKLRIADAQSGERIGAGKAIVRLVGMVLAALPCYVGLLWVAFDRRKQGWHDKIAGTVIVQG